VLGRGRAKPRRGSDEAASYRAKGVRVSGFLATVVAQPTAVGTLRRALAGGRVHHAYLFDGPDGVGKETAAFGLAQALVCERRSAGESDACGQCHACARAVPRAPTTRPVHPDVVVLERGLYDPATIGRRTPEAQEISIDQVRTLVLARAAFPPHEGRAKVFVVRRAEELSISAANALLKTLEEPGARTHFVLLSATPDVLLPTIRSRTQRVRFAPLPDAVVAELLVARGVEPARAAEIASLAGGSMAAAGVLSDPDASAQREAFVARALAAIDDGDASGAYELAEDAKKGDKGALAPQIEALAAALAAQARACAAAPDRRADVAAARHALTGVALVDLDGNASVQLAMEAMLLRMRSL
jgi:DNA polymerase-3 subunit delta'